MSLFLRICVAYGSKKIVFNQTEYFSTFTHSCVIGLFELYLQTHWLLYFTTYNIVCVKNLDNKQKECIFEYRIAFGET